MIILALALVVNVCVSEPQILGMSRGGGALMSLKGASFEFSKGGDSLPSKVHGKGLDVDLDVLQLMTLGGIVKFMKNALEFRQGAQKWSLQRESGGRVSWVAGETALLSFGGEPNTTTVSIHGSIEAQNIEALQVLVDGMQTEISAATTEVATVRDALEARESAHREDAEKEAQRMNKILLKVEEIEAGQCDRINMLNASTTSLSEELSVLRESSANHTSLLQSVNASVETQLAALSIKADDGVAAARERLAVLEANQAEVIANVSAAAFDTENLRLSISALHANTTALWGNVTERVVELLVQDESIGSDVTALIANSSSLREAVDGLETRLAQVHDDARAAGSRVEEAASMNTTALQARTDALDVRVRALNEDLEASMKGLNASVDVSVASMGVILDQEKQRTQTELAALSEQMTRTAASEAQSRIEALEKLSSSVESNRIEGDASLTRSMAELDRSIRSDQQTEMTVLRTSVRGVNGTVLQVNATLSSAIADMQGSMREVEARLGDANSASTAVLKEAFGIELTSMNRSLLQHLHVVEREASTGIATGYHNLTALERRIQADAKRTREASEKDIERLRLSGETLETNVKKTVADAVGKTEAAAQQIKADVDARLSRAQQDGAAATKATETRLGALESAAAAALVETTHQTKGLERLAAQVDATDGRVLEVRESLLLARANLTASNDRFSSAMDGMRDQVQEVRGQLQVVVADVKALEQRPDKAEALRRELEARATAADGRADAAATKITSLETAVKATDARVEQAATRIASLQQSATKVSKLEQSVTKLATLEDAVKAADTKVDKTVTRLTVLEQTATKVGILESALKTSDVKVDQVSTKVVALQQSATKMAVVESGLKAVETKADQTAAKVAALENKMVAVEKVVPRVTTVETGLKAMETRSEQTAGKVTALEQAVKAVESTSARVVALEGTLKTVDKRGEQTAAQLTSLETNVKKEEGRLTALERQHTDRDSAFATATRRLDTLDETARAMDGKISALQATVSPSGALTKAVAEATQKAQAGQTAAQEALTLCRSGSSETQPRLQALQAKNAELEQWRVQTTTLLTRLEATLTAQDARVVALEKELAAMRGMYATSASLDATRQSIDTLQGTMITHSAKVLEAVVATGEVASNANVAVAQQAWREADALWRDIREQKSAAKAKA